MVGNGAKYEGSQESMTLIIVSSICCASLLVNAYLILEWNLYRQLYAGERLKCAILQDHIEDLIKDDQ